jgi:hypothetical protein
MEKGRGKMFDEKRKKCGEKKFHCNWQTVKLERERECLIGKM